MTTEGSGTVRTRATSTQAARLPWWALALPAAAFTALLLLVAGPGQAQASPGRTPAVGRILEHLQQTFVRVQGPLKHPAPQGPFHAKLGS
ncbi:hypothetical protein [Streptomyces sp. CC210A]|uniref:hypothetical protein n=1 Tax=Streptomyces sp. CC210A TaxID=2898184 RepID=UPI0035A8430F